METEGEPTSTDPRRTAGQRWTRRLVAAVSVLGLLVVVVAVPVGIGTQLSIARADSSLTATHANLQRALVRLAATRSGLSATRSQSTSSGSTLAGESAELATDQAELARAQADVFANGVSISDLDTCLSGVEQTLNEIAVGDVNGAATTLGGVSATCKAALPAG